jgi:hypothetical protein
VLKAEPNNVDENLRRSPSRYSPPGLPHEILRVHVNAKPWSNRSWSLAAVCGGGAVLISGLLVLSGGLVDGGGTDHVRAGLSQLGALALLLAVASFAYERFRTRSWSVIAALLVAMAVAVATLAGGIALTAVGLQLASG